MALGKDDNGSLIFSHMTGWVEVWISGAVYILYLDFPKTFDTVLHIRFIYKLKTIEVESLVY